MLRSPRRQQPGTAPNAARSLVRRADARGIGSGGAPARSTIPPAPSAATASATLAPVGASVAERPLRQQQPPIFAISLQPQNRLCQISMIQLPRRLRAGGVTARPNDLVAP